MFDIFDIMRPLAILAAVFISYIYLFHRNIPRQNGFYKNPDWNFFFKRWLAKQKLDEIKITQRKSLDKKLLQKSERPLVLKNEKSSDTLIFYGCDQIGNSLLLRMTRFRHRIADVWIVLRLANGMIWTLPEHPDVRVHEASPGQFATTSGLEFECLDTFSRWRITYSGYLRNQIRNVYRTDIDEDELKFVTFNFFFIASNNPLFWPLDWSSSLMADGISTEIWKSKNWNKLLNIPGNGGYDQFGEIFGQITLPFQETFEIHLPGIRQRRWESTYNINLRRHFSIIGVTGTGCIFTIGAKSFMEDLSHVQYGNVRLPNGEMYSIDWTDFKIPHFTDIEENIPKQYAIHFRAGNYNFKAFIYFQNKDKVNLLQGQPLSWKVLSIPIKFDLNRDHGFGLTTAWFPYEANPMDPKPIIPKKYMKLIYGNSLPNRSSLTLSFRDFEANSKSVSGGKGASLALLSVAANESYFDSDKNFKIPHGFIISTSALRLFLSENSDIYLELRNLEDICYGKIDGNLEICCENIEKLFKNCILGEETFRSIQKSLRDLKIHNNDLSFAVRSSAVDEDGTELSSAGQNETFLGLTNLEDILDGVKMCWASLYSVRSVEYRRKNAQPILSEMAVIVQTMISSEASGVIFTNHSILENSANVLITANYGLGQSVVSGVVDPDTYILSRNYNGTKLKIEEMFIGKKSHIILLKETGGTEILENNSSSSCINEEIILKLAKIGIIMERMYGSPQDIEWAVYKNEIYLLQSRPITTFQKFSDWEYLHEFDSPLMSTNEILTRGNVGESYIGPIDHLTQSTFIKSRTELLEKEFNIQKYENLIPNYGLKLSHNQIFIDILTVFTKTFTSTKLNGLQRAAGFSILGSLNITPEIVKASIAHSGPVDISQIWKINKTILPSIWKSSSNEKRFNKFFNTFQTIYTEKRMKSHLTALDAFNDLEDIINKHLKFTIESHMNISKANGIFQILGIILILDGSNDLTVDHVNDVMKIMSGEKDIISAEIPKQINEIANSIYLYSDYKIFSRLDPSIGEEWLELYAPSSYRKFKQFLTTFGHRGLNEFNFSSKTWEMEPEIVIKMVQDNLKESFSSGCKYEENAEDIVAGLTTPKKKITKLILQYLLPYCRKSVKRREASKNLLVNFVSILRKQFINLSELLCKEGLLPEPELIFYLVRSELQKLIKDRDTGCVRKAIRRQKLFHNWNEYKFPDLVFGVPKPINTNNEKIYELSNGEKIFGLPVQRGCVQGRACVIKSISEINKIKRGDILVTFSTDIAWSPYFPILGGLITELGGLISHGAIVAREYGLPCIIGAQNVTELFKFGDTIILDGDKGICYKN